MTERECNNGGYHRFFINSSVKHVTIIVEALPAIGCPKVAGMTAEAILLLGIDDLTPPMAEATVNDRHDELRDALSACDVQYDGNDEPTADRLLDI